MHAPAVAQRRLRLLEAIDANGSISRSALALHISYKTAWTWLETMSNLAPEPLVERTVGGSRGGGSQLTVRGRALLQALREGARRYERLLREPSNGPRSSGESSQVIPTTGLVLGLESPNQFLAIIQELTSHPEQVYARLELLPGQTLLACVARGTFPTKVRAIGRSICVHVNPSTILLAVGDQVSFSADNQLVGVVKRMRHGIVQSEVVLQLPLERTLTVLVTRESAKRLALRRGLRVRACFSADSVTVVGT